MTKEILKLGENHSYTQTNTEIGKEATISWQTIQVYSSKKKKKVQSDEKIRKRKVVGAVILYLWTVSRIWVTWREPHPFTLLK